MSYLSPITINGVPQTWQQLYEREKAAREALEPFRSLLSDLSRCEHGRHDTDNCSQCGGMSKGNPHTRPGAILGFDIGGRPWIVPTRWMLARIEAWRA